MFFDDSRPDRAKRAARQNHLAGAVSYAASPVPPAKPYEFLTHEELTEHTRTLLYDVECYRNYFLVGFKCSETGKVVYFECFGDTGFNQDQAQRLAFIFYRHKVIGFNSLNYDLPMCAAALMGLAPWKLKEISDEIILEGIRWFDLQRKYNIPVLQTNHVDLIEVAPIEASLKLYGARLHVERLQDLPYPPDAILTGEQCVVVRDYNLNDLDVTGALYNHLKPSLQLRETLSADYGIDLRSKSDAQIAEAVIGSELRKLGVDVRKPKPQPGLTFNYVPPAFLKFKTPQFQHAFDTIKAATFRVNETGYVDLPDEIKALDLRLGSGQYTIGLGGLHSCEKSAGYQADANTLIIDRDVASYYPAIILNNRFFPEHLTEAYLEVYRILTKRRLEAKGKNKVALKAVLEAAVANLEEKARAALQAGHKLEAAKWQTAADSLKIVINGGFGKLGNPFSIFYGPANLIHVTLTGQLSLLMAIEAIELAAIPVISANTDGIVMLCPADRYVDLETIIIAWEEATGFLTEETRYKALYSRDVNNYIAVKEDGKCKTKGVFSEVGSALNSPLSKNPEAYITSMAVQDFLANGVPVHETIENGGVNVPTEYYPTVVSRFVSVRRVRGGAAKDGVYLGKVVRWYYAKGAEGEFVTVTHGSTVPQTTGAKPLMTLPTELPADLDVDWYVDKANAMLYDLGRYQRPTLAKLI